MGCSPSHALIINSPSTQETICLQPRIFMVSDSTLCLLQDVGELRVYRVDERNPETALEKFKEAPDQLQNPLLFHPDLRRAKSRDRSIVEGIASTSNMEETVSSENIEESGKINDVFPSETENSDDDDIPDNSQPSEKIYSEMIKPENDAVESSEYSVEVKVHSHRTTTTVATDKGIEKCSANEAENSAVHVDVVEETLHTEYEKHEVICENYLENSEVQLDTPLEIHNSLKTSPRMALAWSEVPVENSTNSVLLL